MRRSTIAASLSGLGGLLFLASCVGTGDSSNLNEFSTECMFEVNPPGAYVWSDGDTEVKPGGGATAEGAAAMNDCIRRKAAAAGKEVVEVEQTSATTTTKTYTYGAPPASAVNAPQSTDTGKSCRRRDLFSGGSGYFGCAK